MNQLDIFTNPIARARRAYPFVVVLQADLADPGRDRIVAPLVPGQSSQAPQAGSRQMSTSEGPRTWC